MKDVLKFTMYGAIFLIPFLTLYVENDFFFPYITGKNFGFRILVEIAFASWAVLALYDRSYRPRFSWIFVSLTALIVVMFFADLFGQFPEKSFWSNFERMDGYITLFHMFLLFITLGSALQTKRQWSLFLHTSLAAAFLVGLYGLGQYSGAVEARNSRIDSRLGNAAYMAIYMLFHIFIALWFLVESKVTFHRVIYGLLIGMFIFLLLETGTRGTAIGLVVGASVMAAYIGLFGARFKEFRKYAIGLFILLIIGAGGLYTARDSDFVQNNGNLRRIANISVDDLSVRFTIWGIAYEGVKERPVLGWGHGNFNYVFNEHYKPELYAQEQWFDRVHNIFFDWLIAGGVLGFVAYFSILFSCLYYLLVRPLFYKDESFDVLERGVLLGLLAGYFTHNLVVFDNIVSFMFYGTILAFIHWRVAKEVPSIMNFTLDKRIISQVAAPLMVVVVGCVIYFVHLPAIQAAGDIIDAFRATSPQSRLEAFDLALSRDSFADQEIIEQMAQQAISFSRNQQVSQEVRDAFISRTELETLRMIEEKPGDARLHVFLGTFYRTLGTTEGLDAAREQFAIARSLSPNKQSIILQQGSIEFAANNLEAGTEFFKEAYELDTRNLEAKEYYAAALFFTDRPDEGEALIDSDVMMKRAAVNDFLLGGVNASGDQEFLAKLYTVRTQEEPTNPQNWASLAFIYYQLEEPEKAIETLHNAAEVIPTFAPTANCFADNIENGREPQTECN